MPLIQINPKGINLAAIASGKYDGYLSSYAEAVRSYQLPVILSFGHEMNGSWYSWGYRHTSPEDFRGRLAAHRHAIPQASGPKRDVAVDGQHHAHGRQHFPSSTWWPGNKYVTWVGLDGYYYKPSWTFAPLFGPTITAIRELTRDPILIAETSVSPTTNQPAKID